MRRSRSSRGIALVAVLWVVVLLAVIGAAVISETHTEYRAVRNAIRLAAGEAVADAAIHRAIADLLDSAGSHRWRIDGTPAPFQFDGQTVSVAVQDELGKIDLNYAADELLTGLFRSVGVDSRRSAALLDAISDWRDEDDLHRLNGAEAPDYRDAGRRYTPRNGLFQTVDELRLVLGMDDALFKRLEPALTVYSQNRGIDVETAPREALRALPGMDDPAVERRVRARSARADGGPGQPGAPPPTTNFAGRAFTIRAELDGVDGRVIREAVVRLTFNPQKPFVVQAWRSRRND
jgi:general secretion pathway protein K